MPWTLSSRGFSQSALHMLKPFLFPLRDAMLRPLCTFGYFSLKVLAGETEKSGWKQGGRKRGGNGRREWKGKEGRQREEGREIWKERDMFIYEFYEKWGTGRGWGLGALSCLLYCHDSVGHISWLNKLSWNTGFLIVTLFCTDTNV